MTTAQVNAFAGKLRERVREPSVASALRLLRRVFNVAVAEGRITTNPVVVERVRRAPAREMLFLEAADVEALSKAVAPCYRVLVLFLAYTGARIGEAAGLKVKHVDLLRRRVRIEQASTEVDGHLHLGPTKTKQKRTITLPRFLAEELTLQLAEFGAPDDPEAWVFRPPRGPRVRQKAFRSVLKTAARKSGLPETLRTHDLRHTAVALATQVKWHPKQIQEMLGDPGLGARKLDGERRPNRESLTERCQLHRVSSGPPSREGIVWIFTQDTFVSAVRHRDHGNLLLVRARDRDSLVSFCQRVRLAESQISELTNADYRFRVICSDAVLLRFLRSSVEELDYDNFKGRVSRKRGAIWHDALTKVWTVMRSLQPSPGEGG